MRTLKFNVLYSEPRMMNGSDAFDLCEVVKDEEPVIARVVLEPYDDVHPFTENIEEDLDKDTSSTDSFEGNS